jgi:hypothetical protein
LGAGQAFKNTEEGAATLAASFSFFDDGDDVLYECDRSGVLVGGFLA